MCGEEKTEATVWWSFLEIPPRVRGREPLTKGTLLASGNTPACAGKSFAAQCQGGDYRKYPRVCGEEPSVAGSCKVVMEIPPRVRGRAIHYQRAERTNREIPPRVRGREVHCVLRTRRYGNTPACAGKSLLLPSACLVFRKYPRVCGEEFARLAQSASSLEIPPRVRGRA